MTGPVNATFMFADKEYGLRADARALRAAEVRNGEPALNTVAAGAGPYSCKVWNILEELIRSAGGEPPDEDTLMRMAASPAAQAAIEAAFYDALDLASLEKKTQTRRKR